MQTLSGMSLFKSIILYSSTNCSANRVLCILYFSTFTDFLHVYEILVFFYTSFQILTTMFLVILTHLKNAYHVK